ncbi:K02A2.6-like [Cordylochernes scorpioides]|uniref:K02A2.6-like n=1 Tax=Cordylochernes scorpioides TaxID=51811 RepID=A0ABY6KDS8_9ARAC|nr:K02A2.6-like [Cordylochernes scorpioides]
MLGTDTITDTSVRRSRRLEGLEPRFDIDEKNSPIRKISMSAVVNTGVKKNTCKHLTRNPTVFSGNGTEDCGKWMKDYERIARSNCWDTTMKLANAPFFLEGTAGQWYDNNEEGIDSWDMFKEMFSWTFDNSGVLLRRAKDNLQSRAQKSTESCESYIQDVLSLRRQENPNMSKEEKVAHLMKGVVEDVYQVILIKEIDTVEAFVDWCRKVEACKQRRIGKPRFERLPNVASIEQPNSSSLEDLIRQIVREEIKSVLHSESIVPEVNSLKKIIHEEVERNLTPIAEQGPYYREQRRQFEGPAKPPPYYQQQNPTRLTTARRKTDEWRTVDNIPVCFQCGRPGHVARYCRERRGMVDRQPPGRYHPVQNGPRTIYNSNEAPGRASYRSPSPYPGRGRSPAERRPSISPSRRSGRSPYQQAPFVGGKVAEEIINPPPLIAAKLSQNIVHVTIDDKTFPALVDNGASFSVISDHFRQQHKMTMFSDAGMTLRVADGKYIVSRGRCTLRLEINELVQPFEFIVLPSCSHDIILGWDFLEASRAIIDCGSAEILLEKAELPEDYSSIFQTVAADDSFIIPAGSTKQINVISEAILGVSDVVMEPSRILFLERDLMVPASIFAVQHGKGRIWITNIGTCDRTVPKGMCIGEIQVLEEGHLAVIGDASDTNRQGILGQENSPNIASMISPDLSMLERTRICSILGSFSGLFEFNKFPSNLTSTAKHKINTEDHPPIKRRPYRVSQVERQTIQNEVDKMLKGGIVQLSGSPWSSPVVLVKKKNGSWRFCVDYRHLNKITKKDVYPLPRIDDTLDCLRGASYYSSMDLRSGYWQIEVDEADREKTAFITPDGLYEFKVMPFGLCNAPATFERMMDTLLRGLKWSMCLCYLDDIIVFSPTFDEHVRRLDLVLRCLSKARLVLNPDKCLFGTKRLSIFGHLVDGEGVHPEKSFIGMCSYYRRFIKNFAQKAEPLHRLLRKDTRFEWGPDQRQVYESLKLALALEPVLAHFDEKYATELHTDASGFGIGAVLVQVQGGSEKPIGYASRTLSTAEKNYSTTKRECLAAIWAIGKFRPYLFGRSFTIVTDHHSLCWLSGLKDPVGIDLLGRFPISHLGNKWIIVCKDYLTRYAITRALPSADAQQVAKFVLEDVSKLISELTGLCSSTQRFTTAYHPQTNGLTERLNKTLADMMSMYVDVEQKEWDVILPFITFAYNTAKQDTTGFTPFSLIHGREVETTLDTLFPLLKDEDQEDYNREIVTRAEETRQLARLHTLRAQEGNKRLYDAKHREVSYQPGDKVWIFIPVRKIGISEKLIKRYFGPYRVTRRISDVTYEVESLDTTNRRRKPKEIVHVVRMKNYRDPDEQLDLPEDEPAV